MGLHGFSPGWWIAVAPALIARIIIRLYSRLTEKPGGCINSMRVVPVRARYVLIALTLWARDANLESRSLGPGVPAGG